MGICCASCAKSLVCWVAWSLIRKMVFLIAGCYEMLMEMYCQRLGLVSQAKQRKVTGLTGLTEI